MRSQELLFAAGAVLMIGLVSALLFFSGGEQAAPATPAADAREAAQPPPAPEPVVSQDPPILVRATDVREPDTRGWTKGTILGDILLAASAVPRLQSISVSVIELRNPVPGGKEPPPFHLVVPVPIGAGTP